MALVQTGTAWIGTSSNYYTQAAVSTPSAVKAGSLLILMINNSATTDAVTSVTDNLNNTWTRTGTPASAGNLTSQFWYAVPAAAGATTVTVKTGSSYLAHELIIREYDSMATSSPVDANTRTIESGYVTNHTVSATMANATNVLIAAYACTANTDTFTAGSGYANLVKVSGAPNLCCVVADQTVTTTGSKSASFTSSLSDQGIVWLIGFKQGTGAVVLAPPSSVTATAGNGVVNLSWPSVSGAVRYKVYRSTDPNSQGAEVPGSGTYTSTYGGNY